MSKWTHSICNECWLKLRGDRVPIRLVDPQNDICCFCSKQHTSGIFMRLDPADMPCNGQH